MGFFKRLSRKKATPSAEEERKIIPRPVQETHRPQHKVTHRVRYLQAMNELWTFKPKRRIRQVLPLPDGSTVFYSPSKSSDKYCLFTLDGSGEVVKDESERVVGTPPGMIGQGGGYYIGHSTDHVNPSEDGELNRWDSKLEFRNPRQPGGWTIELKGRQVTHSIALQTMDLIIVATRRNHQIGDGELLCFDIHGRNLWTFKDHSVVDNPMFGMSVKFFPYGIRISEENRNILINFINILYCVDFNGKLVWKRDVQSLVQAKPTSIDVGGATISISLPTPVSTISTVSMSTTGHMIAVLCGGNLLLLNRNGKLIREPLDFGYDISGIHLSESGRTMVMLFKDKVQIYREGKVKGESPLIDSTSARVEIREKSNLIIIGLADKRLKIFTLDGELLVNKIFEKSISLINLSQSNERLIVIADKIFSYALEYGEDRPLHEIETEVEEKQVEADKTKMLWRMDGNYLKENPISAYSLSDNGYIVAKIGTEVGLITPDGKIAWKRSPKDLIPTIGRKIDRGDGRYGMEHSNLRNVQISNDGKLIWIATHDTLIWEPSKLILLDNKGRMVWTIETETVVDSLVPLEDYGLSFETYDGQVKHFDDNYQEVSKSIAIGKVVSIDRKGKIVSESPLEELTDEAMLTSEVTLCIEGKDIVAMNLDGQEFWRFTATARISDLDITLDKDRILIRAGVNMFLLNATGNLIWKKKIGSKAAYACFIPSRNGIMAISLENGVAFYDMEGSVMTSIPLKGKKEIGVLTNERDLYLIHSGDKFDRYLYLVNNNGDLLWTDKTVGYPVCHITPEDYFAIKSDNTFALYRYTRDVNR